MAGERFVLLGLAPARAPWFTALSEWTTSAAVAAEFVKCVSAEEVRARLAGGRRHSALLADLSAPGLDRDLVDLCTAHATPVIVVGLEGARPGALDLGAAAWLAPRFGPDDLVEVLAVHCLPVGRGATMPASLGDAPEPIWRAPLFTVCGPGGTGASTVAIALASGLGRDPRLGGRVLLADLARRAEQAVLHDSPQLGPGLQELVDAHRLARPEPEEIDRMTFLVPRRGYRLLLGLRQPEGWAGLRPRAVDAAISGLRQTFTTVVADVTGDFEGADQGGSADVEERNHAARSAALQSTVVVAVGAPGMKGVHALAVLIRQLSAIGVGPQRILPVINRSPRHPHRRAEAARALDAILKPLGIAAAVASPIPLPERKLEDVHRDGNPLPAPIVDPITRAVRAVADRVADAAPADPGPVRLAPGSLGTWSDTEVGP